MLLATALRGMSEHKEALLAKGTASNPTYISEHAHRLAQYISVAEEKLADLEYELENNSAKLFDEHISSGKSVNASKEAVKHELTKERSEVARVSRLVSSSWKLVGEAQSRVKHLIAEANNQI